MDEFEANAIAETWQGGEGLVPRGPRWLLGCAPASPDDVERHTGDRPRRDEVWRIQVGGRFLRAGGLVYPGGVPFPEDLRQRTAVVSSEVWLYVDAETSAVWGMHSWPEAIRRPIAAAPEEDFSEGSVRAPGELDPPFNLRLPSHPGWDPALAVERPSGEIVVLLTRDVMPDPLNEMLLFEEGGLSLRASPAEEPPDFDAVLRQHQPPFRPVRIAGAAGAGRDPGRSLGPQTWPWPGELWWWADGVSYELKGFVDLSELRKVAATLEPVG